MKLSIIICVYNTDKEYFEGCLRSITESTLDKGDYEICVIDDGSDIDYGELVKKYSLKYKKTENRGIFQARLLGICEAAGDYIAFVDSDDTVSFNYHAPMLKRAVEDKCDIVFNDWAFHTERSRYYCAKDTTIARDISVLGDGVLPFFLSQCGREHSYYVLWNKLFSGRILKACAEELMPIACGEVRFNFSEDALICFHAFLMAKRVENVHTGYYFYRIHSGQTVNVISDEKLSSQISCMAKTFDIMRERIPESPEREKMLKHVREWQLLMARTHFSHAKANKYLHLYDLIKEKYKTDKLEPSTYRDGSVYASGTLLAKNFTEIDAALLSLFLANDAITVSTDGTDGYMRRSLEYIAKKKDNITLGGDGVRLPEPFIPFRDKLILNPVIYRIGLVLFKKGSRLRAFLKKHI